MDQGEHRFPFCVDAWTSCPSSSRRRHHFLTHAHLDHTRGIASHNASPIYCTSVTAQLVLLRHAEMRRSAFVEIFIEEPRLIEDEDGSFTVTAYDANHCPGAVMFLFEGVFGVVLHSGDCRLTPECYMRLPRRLYNGSLDILYLDCTFGNVAVRMPSREEALKQVKQCIWNHPEAPTVYLACDLLGQEMLLKSLSCCFGFKIFVDKHALPDFYASLAVVVPGIITDDAKSTRLHVCEGFPKLYERAKHKFAEAHSKGQPEPLFIRPSAQWYTYGEKLDGVGSGLLLLEKIYEKAPSITRRRAKSVPKDAERDPFGIWHVCYSMHSSQEELEACVSKIRPRQVISTTPHCRATELSFVRTLKSYDVKQSTIVTMVGRVPAEGGRQDKEEPSAKPKITIKPPLLPVPSPVENIPLFGRAVVGLSPSPPLFFDSEVECSSYSEEEDSAHGDEDNHIVSANIDHCLSLKINDNDSVSNKLLRGSCIEHEYVVSITEKVGCRLETRSPSKASDDGSPVSKQGSLAQENNSLTVECGFGETTRRIYRSFNMVIPRPLPSLLELDREIKRSRF